MSATKYKKTYATLARNYCMLGGTNDDLAMFLGVCPATIDNWIRDNEDFREAVMFGREHADANVAKSLYRRAMGYSHRDVDIRQHGGQIIKTDIIKHYPPDTTACIFWLKNRRRRDWRDRHEVGLSTVVPIVIKGESGKELMTLGTESRIEDKGQP